VDGERPWLPPWTVGLHVGDNDSKIPMALYGNVKPIWQDPLLIQPAMCSWHLKTNVEAKEEIAQVACTLTGRDDPWPRMVRVSFVEEEQLNLGVHLIATVTDRRRNPNPERLHSYMVNKATRLISRGTHELKWD
jgi:hypothetical protein